MANPAKEPEPQASQAAPSSAKDVEAELRRQLEEEYKGRLAARTAEQRKQADIEALTKKEAAGKLTEKERLELNLARDGGSILYGGQVYAHVEDLPAGWDKPPAQPEGS
jgi:acetyl-CoA carboxylase carboxyltransferase component